MEKSFRFVTSVKYWIENRINDSLEEIYFASKEKSIHTCVSSFACFFSSDGLIIFGPVTV